MVYPIYAFYYVIKQKEGKIVSFVIKKMEFPLNKANDVMDAKKVAKDIPVFRADDEYIRTVIKDNVMIENGICKFTQILEINNVPDYLDNGVVIDNAARIMKFYKQWTKKKCGIIKWAVFTTINPSTAEADAQEALGLSIEGMEEKTDKYNEEDSG